MRTRDLVTDIFGEPGPHGAHAACCEAIIRAIIDDPDAAPVARGAFAYLRLRYRFDGDTASPLRTYAAVSQIFRVTRERARQCVEKALRLLRHPHQSNRLRAHWGLPLVMPAHQFSSPFAARSGIPLEVRA